MSASRPATSVARRVLPTPPTPVNVTNRCSNTLNEREQLPGVHRQLLPGTICAGLRQRDPAAHLGQRRSGADAGQARPGSGVADPRPVPRRRVRHVQPAGIPELATAGATSLNTGQRVSYKQAQTDLIVDVTRGTYAARRASVRARRRHGADGQSQPDRARGDERVAPERGDRRVHLPAMAEALVQRRSRSVVERQGLFPDEPERVPPLAGDRQGPGNELADVPGEVSRAGQQEPRAPTSTSTTRAATTRSRCSGRRAAASA